MHTCCRAGRGLAVLPRFSAREPACRKRQKGWGFRFRKKESQRNLFETRTLGAPAKRRRLLASWAETFRRRALPLIDEEQFAPLYCEDNGRPNRPVQPVWGRSSAQGDVRADRCRGPGARRPRAWPPGRWQTGVNGSTGPTHSLGPVLQWFPPHRVVSVCAAGSGHHYRDPRGDQHYQYQMEDSVPSRRLPTAIRALPPAPIGWGGRPCSPECWPPSSAAARPVAGACGSWPPAPIRPRSGPIWRGGRACRRGPSAAAVRVRRLTSLSTNSVQHVRVGGQSGSSRKPGWP